LDGGASQAWQLGVLTKLKCGKDEQNSTNARLCWQNCYRPLLLLEFYNMPYYLFILKKLKHICVLGFYKK
jgi:hypothetical protein